MAKATWNDDTQNPVIDWRMSAALENAVHKHQDITEVTSLEGPVREWLTLDPEHRTQAVLPPEQAITI